MKVCVLTSTRADYGIYLPLLKKLQANKFFDLRLIAFGTHLSPKYGRTIDAIKKDGFKIDYAFNTAPKGDGQKDIALNIALVQQKFAAIWAAQKNNYDLVFCLGDRYEMFAAVSAGAPFGIKFAHLYGGETTLGAIDEVYRAALTVFSKLHFTATAQNQKNVRRIIGQNQNVFNVGALGLDNLKDVKLYNADNFKKLYGVKPPFALITLHPETATPKADERNIKAVLKALDNLKMPALITMPNADAGGLYLRRELQKYAAGKKDVFTVETMGTRGYLTAMKYCAFMLGNSSSGIIEAASLGCRVIDVGLRQAGRQASPNTVHIAADASKITAAAKAALKAGAYKGKNIYWQGGAADKIITALKKVKL